MEGFIYSLGRIFNYSSDILFILIPIGLVLFLLYKFIFPHNKKAGGLLMAGTSILGYFLVRSKLNNALSIEKRIAEYNQDMADFKNRQKTRANLVHANKTIITNLEKQAEKLKKNEEKYSDELNAINAEINERKKLNEKVLSDTDAFIEASEQRSKERRKILEQLKNGPETVGIVQSEITPENNSSGELILIDGYSLKEVV